MNTKINTKKSNKNKKENKKVQKKVVSCCVHKKEDKKCRRTKDEKIFNLPRKFDREICITKEVKGFTMKSSCAPYKNCTKKEFLYNKDNPSKSFNVYIDKDPTDTIPIKYTTIEDVKNTIKKLEKLYKAEKYTHKRIFQVSMILYVRLKVLKEKKPEHYKLAKKYFEFIKSRTKVKGKTKEETLKKKKKIKI